ncbi:MAG: shikimate kinase [Bacteroidota bacterium]
MNIYLLGFMGSGKSFTGRQLAELMGYAFYDLDEQIEEAAGCSISELFARQGEAAFRALERQQLHRTADYQNAVIATGGGTPCFYDNIDWINRQGWSIYLKASPALLAQRLMAETAQRPLLADLNKNKLHSFIEDKLKARQHFYQQARTIYTQKNQNAPIAPILLQLILA